MKINRSNSTNAVQSTPPVIAPQSAPSMLNRIKGIGGKTITTIPADSPLNRSSAPPVIAPSSPAGGILGQLKAIKTASAPPVIASQSAPPVIASQSAPPVIASNDIIMAINKISGKISEASSLTLEKFAAVESMKKALDEMHAIFCAFIGAYERISGEQNGLAIETAKTVNAIRAEMNTIKQIRGEVKTASAPPVIASQSAPPVITHKKALPIAPQNSPLINADSSALYRAFQAQFGGSFCGSKELDHLTDFEAIIESLPETNDRGALDKAIRENWTSRRSSGLGQYCAAKSLANMVNAILEVLTSAGIIDSPQSAPPVIAPPVIASQSAPPVKVINAEILGNAFQFSPAELRDMVNEIKENKNMLPRIRTLLMQYSIDNGLESVNETSINDLINFAIRS